MGYMVNNWRFKMAVKCMTNGISRNLLYVSNTENSFKHNMLIKWITFSTQITYFDEIISEQNNSSWLIRILSWKVILFKCINWNEQKFLHYTVLTTTWLCFTLPEKVLKVAKTSGGFNVMQIVTSFENWKSNCFHYYVLWTEIQEIIIRYKL